ncbi:hypothetical protein Lesp02_48840 [Lentzea sp. NBRC 105346]|nr:hypothetical protein Lesp02_48840 [Lentzea sp. NBRC 105346]
MVVGVAGRLDGDGVVGGYEIGGVVIGGTGTLDDGSPGCDEVGRGVVIGGSAGLLDTGGVVGSGTALLEVGTTGASSPPPPANAGTIAAITPPTVTTPATTPATTATRLRTTAPLGMFSPLSMRSAEPEVAGDFGWLPWCQFPFA